MILKPIFSLLKRISLTANWYVVVIAGFITIIGFTASTTMADGQKAMDNYTERSQAYYIALGGTEYAKILKEKGMDVSRTNMELGEGTFTITETEDGYLQVESNVDGEVENLLADY
jgi:hypothetical protein